MTGTPPLLRRTDALFLDFDGTLVEIAPRPELVAVPPDLLVWLRAVQAELGGALAIVTGRQLADLDRYLAPLSLPGAGLHGAQLRIASGEVLSPPPPSTAVRAAVAALREAFEDASGVLIEDKGLSVALHYRNAPERAAECEQVLLELAQRLHLSPLHGKQVIEARALAVNKGDGIDALMKLPAFAGRKPVFAGDDLTDEYGFEAVSKAGGVTLKVGLGDSSAAYRLENVAALHHWLERSVQNLAA